MNGNVIVYVIQSVSEANIRFLCPIRQTPCKGALLAETFGNSHQNACKNLKYKEKKFSGT